jgi:DNA-binding IclR family transcriptional regulator
MRGVIMSIANTFDKGLKLLELFTEERPSLTLRDVAELSGLTKPTALRLLNTLEVHGFLMRDKGKAYCLGLRLLELGNFVAERLDVRAAAVPHMDELLFMVDQAVNLVIRDGMDGVYIEKRETTHPVRMYTRVGRRAPLYAGACPRALLAFLPDKEREDIIDRLEIVSYTATTPVDKDDLRQRIAREREMGYTFSQGELFDGSASIAIPIRDYTRKVVAALSITGSQSSFVEDKHPYMVKALAKAASDISAALGYPRGAMNDAR